jgi:hypothetical protein
MKRLREVILVKKLGTKITSVSIISRGLFRL